MNIHICNHIDKNTFVCYHSQKGGDMLKLRIKEIAEAQGLNRNQLQLKSGVTLPLLTRYWNNQTKAVRLEALERIAMVLGVDPGDLISSDEDKTVKIPVVK